MLGQDIVLPPDRPVLTPPPTPPPTTRTPEEHLYAMAEKYKVDPQLALAIIKQESGGRQTGPDGQPLTSSAGAKGFFQLLPQTAYGEFQLDPTDPFQNIEAGVRYLRQGMDRSSDGTIRSVAAYYHGGPDQKQWGPVTNQYAQAIENGLRQQLAAPTTQRPAAATRKIDPLSPASIAATAAANKAATAPVTPAATTVGVPPPHPKTLWERMTGTTTEVPPDVQTELSATQGRMAGTLPSDTGGDVLAGNVKGAYEGVKHAYNPMTRQGRRNWAGTAGAVALTPLAIAAAPEVLAGSALYGIGAGALASGGAGALEETGEQVAEGLRGERTTPDVPAVLGAGGQQAAQDVLGHAMLAPLRVAGRAIEGPGVARAVSAGMAAERESWGTFFQNAIDTLRQQARDLRFKFGAEATGRTVATEGAVEAARRRAAEMLGAGEATTARNVDVARQAAGQQVADVTAQGEAATGQAGAAYTQDIGLPPSETAAGRQVVSTLEGPAKGELNTLGEAVKAATKNGPAQDLKAIQDEARRLVREEILPPERALPRELPTPPQPGAPPTPPPAIDPELGIAITSAEREAIARHPVMAVLQRILNAKGPIKFSDLADFATELGAATDFDSPVAGKMEGVRKHLYALIRAQLGTHPEYDAAAGAYSAARQQLTEGYAGQAAKIGDVEPARIVQAISPTDPLQTKTLMDTLTTHNPEAAAAVRQAWLYKHVLQGGIEGLGKRLQILRESPEFARALFGKDLPAVLDRYGQMASGFEGLTAGAKQAVERTAAETAEGVSAAEALGAQRAGALKETGRAGVQAAKEQGKAGARAAGAVSKGVLKQIQDQLAELGIKKTARTKVTPQEELALSYAQKKSQQIVDVLLGTTHPGSFRGTVGLVRLLSGPRSAELLAMAANRPEVSKLLLNWLADPNAALSYRVVKRLLGQEVQEHGAAPAWEKFKGSRLGQSPPKLGDTPLYTVGQAPPRR